jgi:glucose-1-phosphate thymidylyltransferase
VKPVDDPSRFGVASVKDGQIERLVEKPKNPESNLAMAGLYFFGPELWSILPDLPPSARGEYEITDAIQMLIDRGHTVLAGHIDHEWFDTGTLDSFLETSAFLVEGGALVSEDASVEGKVGSKVIVGAGARVRCALIEDAVVLPGANVEVGGAIRHAILAGTVLREGAVENEILHGDWNG